MFASTFLKISVPLAIASAVSGQVIPFQVKRPLCVTLPDIAFEGIAEFVDVDSSGFAPPVTTGDMSISADLLPVPALPTGVNFYEIKSICLATEDLGIPPVAPTCIWEAELEIDVPAFASFVGTTVFAGKFTAAGSGPEGYSITGGTDGFFGAFGSVETGGSFQSSPCTTPPCQPGDLLISFGTSTHICWWLKP